MIGVMALPLDCLAVPTVESSAPATIQWMKWSDETFARAAKEKKLLLLDLEANWCHWCHVMEEETYHNPEVVKFVGSSFIAIREDQAARPDLAARYDDYGWPATIVLDANGHDLWKESGFVPPQEFLEALNEVVKNPGKAVSKKVAVAAQDGGPEALSAETRKELLARHYRSLDRTLGGIDSAQRFLTPMPVEIALREAAAGQEPDRAWVTLTLVNNLKLIDRAWGGAYQYSTDRDWEHPHFEKIMSTQAHNLRLYALGFQALGDKRFLDAALAVRRYVNTFLRDTEGAYYASQDADLVKGEHSAEYFAQGDAARRAKGVPAVDKNIYSRENGWIARALATFYGVTQDEAALVEASSTVRWIETHRSLGEGGFSHGDHDVTPPLLEDQVAMLYAYVTLYQVTADRSYLAAARRTIEYISKNFFDTNSPGATSTKIDSSPKNDRAPGLATQVRLIDANVDLARAANLLFQYSGDETARKVAGSALKFLARDDVALEYRSSPGIIMADDEFRNDPLHITVVAQKDSAPGKALFLAALKQFGVYRRIEWWDKREGPLPRADVEYPELPQPAAFLCSNKRCSLPIFEPAEIAETLERFRKSRG